ncbi:MAG: DinB family protein [Gemmatimonadales bacterium]
MYSPFLSEQVRLAHAGPAWHGASLAENHHGINAEQAASRPVPDAHSVWELVLHLTAWTNEVTRRLNGGEPGAPVEGDWPAVGRVSEEAWSRARAALDQAHAELAAAVERFPEDRWSDRVGGERDAPLGTGVSYAAMVAGLLQHDAYHGGQVGLLRKALRL